MPFSITFRCVTKKSSAQKLVGPMATSSTINAFLLLLKCPCLLTKTMFSFIIEIMISLKPSNHYVEKYNCYAYLKMKDLIQENNRFVKMSTARTLKIKTVILKCVFGTSLRNNPIALKRKLLCKTPLNFFNRLILILIYWPPSGCTIQF